MIWNECMWLGSSKTSFMDTETWTSSNLHVSQNVLFFLTLFKPLRGVKLFLACIYIKSRWQGRWSPGWYLLNYSVLNLKASVAWFETCPWKNEACWIRGFHRFLWEPRGGVPTHGRDRDLGGFGGRADTEVLWILYSILRSCLTELRHFLF